MRIFISSVRRGLETERDALPALLRAIGHEPARFEDFGAQAEPSREACLLGVEASDLYLLLLGPFYGHRFEETGQSPTHDEWVAATTKGMPRLVFRKTGVDLEPDQQDFARLVGDYSSGVFYAEYSDTADLLTKVAEGVRRLAEAPSPLTYEPLPTPPAVTWKGDWAAAQPTQWGNDPACLELHIVPIAGQRRPARLMRELPARLAAGVRSAGAVPVESGVALSGDDEAAVVEIPQERGRYDQARPAALLGIRLAATGQLSMWSTLPGDQMGSILDVENMASTLAGNLRLAGALNVLAGDRFAIAIGLGGSLMLVSLDAVTGAGRSTAQMGHTSGTPIRVDPDESVTTAAFDRGADEVARSLATALINAFRSGG